MDFVSQQHWDKSYQDFNYHIAKDDITNWIDKYEHLFSEKGSLFEFGCYPGRYLSYLGKKGWIVNGLDLTPGIEGRFVNWLHKEGIKSGIIKKMNAVEYASFSNDKYDMVCSFGFIEHFTNFTHMIELHDRLLKPGGWLLITTPNFKGSIQKLLHQNLNKENLKIHYLPSMQPSLWKGKLKEIGYTVYYSGYFGGFEFWYDKEDRNSFQKFALKLIRKITPLLKKLPDSSSYSPYCGIIAQKLT